MKVAELIEKLQAFGADWEVGHINPQTLKWMPLKAIELEAMRPFQGELIIDLVPGDQTVFVARLKP